MGNLMDIKVALCDLDGVVWLAHSPIDGSVSAIERLRRRGIRVLFVTNNSFSTRGQQVSALEGLGIPAEGDVVTSAMAAASILPSGSRVLVCGGAGLEEEVARAGSDVVVAHRSPRAGGRYDAVVVGMHREFDYTVLSDALAAVEGGAALIGSNSDSTYPTPRGLEPGGGSILAAIEHATGVKATVTGKPHLPMASLVRALVPDVAVEHMLMIGDRSDTDGAFARTLECSFALVLSGVTTAPADASTSLVASNLAGVVDHLLASGD